MSQRPRGIRGILIAFLLATSPSLLSVLIMPRERPAVLFSGYRSYAAIGASLNEMMKELVTRFGDSIICSLTQEVAISRIDAIEQRNLNALKLAQGDPRSRDPYISGVRSFFAAFSPTGEVYEVFYVSEDVSRDYEIKGIAQRFGVVLINLDAPIKVSYTSLSIVLLILITAVMCLIYRKKRSLVFMLAGAVLLYPLASPDDPIAMASAIILLIVQQRIYDAMLPTIINTIIDRRSFLSIELLKSLIKSLHGSIHGIVLALSASIFANRIPLALLSMTSLFTPIILQALYLEICWWNAERMPFAHVPMLETHKNEYRLGSIIISLIAVIASFLLAGMDAQEVNNESSESIGDIIVPSVGLTQGEGSLPGLEDYRRHNEFQESLAFSRFLDPGIKVYRYTVKDGILVDIIPDDKVKNTPNARASPIEGFPLLESMLARQTPESKPSLASLHVARKVQHATLLSLIAAIMAIVLLLAPRMMLFLGSDTSHRKPFLYKRKWKERLRQV